MTEAKACFTTPQINPHLPSTDDDLALRFKKIDDAEAFLKSQGFRIIPNTCNWTNAAGDDAGVTSIDGHWGEVTAWRVEIKRRVVELSDDKRDLDPREVLTELFTEEPIPNPDLMADLIVARLGSRGFLIIGRTERPEPPRRQ